MLNFPFVKIAHHISNNSDFRYSPSVFCSSFIFGTGISFSVIPIIYRCFHLITFTETLIGRGKMFAIPAFPEAFVSPNFVVCCYQKLYAYFHVKTLYDMQECNSFYQFPRVAPSNFHILQDDYAPPQSKYRIGSSTIHL